MAEEDATSDVLVFAGHDYYPEGGWRDFVGAFASVADAIAAVKEGGWGARAWSHQWAHVVADGHIVWALGMNFDTGEAEEVEP